MRFNGEAVMVQRHNSLHGVAGVPALLSAGGNPASQAAAPALESQSIPFRRAALVVRCASEILGLQSVPEVAELKLDLTVQEFGDEFTRRFGATHPTLVYRTESSIERARLVRNPAWKLPKVVLRQGAPPKHGAARTREE